MGSELRFSFLYKRTLCVSRAPPPLPDPHTLFFFISFSSHSSKVETITQFFQENWVVAKKHVKGHTTSQWSWSPYPDPHGFKADNHWWYDASPPNICSTVSLYSSLQPHAISSQNPHASAAMQMEQMSPLGDHKNTNMTECPIQSCRYRKKNGGSGLQSKDSFLLLIHSLLSAFFILIVRYLCMAVKALCHLSPDRGDQWSEQTIVRM